MSGCTSPVAMIKVRGRHRELGCELDPANLVLGEPIGEDGSRSQVFAAQYHEPCTGISHDVAVKRFPPARTQHELKNIHREVGVMYLASTRCHHCARCWGYVQDSDGALMLVMKRYNESLNSKLRAMPNGCLPLSHVQRFGLQIAKAGMELHAQNVVLSDLKPANMLLDEFDDIAVADFGISTLLKRGEEQDDGLHGTFNYMPPEAFDPESFGRLSTQSDIWSFACCIVEMVSGQRPWSGTQMSAICYKITSAREIPEIPSDLPLAVRNLLQACFAYDSSARPTFAEIHKVFAQPWVEAVARAAVPSDDDAVISDITENADLLRLRHEEARWDVQRKELISKVRRDACLIAEMQKNVVEHQEVNEKLQEQLVLLVNSLKHQQGQPSNAGALVSDPARYAAQLELQLAGCQDALKFCMRQKDVAKEMLRQESSRTSQLTCQVAKLHKQQDRMQDMALHLAVQTKLAEGEMSKLCHDVAAEKMLHLHLPSARHPSTMGRIRQARKPSMGAPVMRGLYGSDSAGEESVRDSRESSSSNESLELKRARELMMGGGKFESLSLMTPTNMTSSCASTPSPMLSQASTPMLVSSQNSWETATQKTLEQRNMALGIA